MILINSKVRDLSITILPFLIILSSIIITESICHTFLRTELGCIENKYFIIELSTAFFAPLLIVSLFFRKQQLSTDIHATELPRVKSDWEKTFNTMTDFISVHDENFKIIKANQALCDFLGKSPEEIIGKSCYQIFHNANEAIDGCPHLKTSETGHSVTEIINDPHIGVPLQVTCSPLFNDDKTFQGSVHIARTSEPVDRQRNKVREIIPICAGCKSIRQNNNTWVPPENYFIEKYDYQFTHSICRHCQERLYPEYIKS